MERQNTIYLALSNSLYGLNMIEGIKELVALDTM